MKYLKDNGIKNFDSLIITHFDNDHAGGADDLINNLKINKLYVNDLNHKSISALKSYNAAIKNNVKIIKSDNGQIVYNANNLSITNFTPQETNNDNDNSIITLLKYNNFSMLFTGDASSESLHSISPKLPENITVLKVPHHGALGGIDIEIVQHLNPKYAIIF